MHRPRINLRAHVPLRAIFMDNIPQPRRHGGTRERHSDRPVRVDAVAIILIRVAEIDEATFADGPIGSHAGAGLV